MSYTVLEEFIILRDQKAVHYSDVGSKVELSDDEAAELLAAGKVCEGDPPAVEPPALEPEVIRSPFVVAEEFIILRDGAAVHYSDIGSTALLSDDEAAEPLAAGQVERPAADEPEPVAETAPDPALAEWLTAESQYKADVSEWLEAEKQQAKKSQGRRES